MPGVAKCVICYSTVLRMGLGTLLFHIHSLVHSIEQNLKYIEKKKTSIRFTRLKYRIEMKKGKILQSLHIAEYFMMHLM